MIIDMLMHTCQFIIIYFQVEKTKQGSKRDETTKQARMYASGGKDCPVGLLEDYISKLNENCDFFFQRPKRNFLNSNTWYDNMVLGVNKISTMMSTISRKAELSQVFTNHCLRATAATALSQSGMERSVIKTITGHRHASSLDPYIQVTPTATKHRCSEILSNYSHNSDITSSGAASTSQSLTYSMNETQMQHPFNFFQGASFQAGANVTVNINNK